MSSPQRSPRSPEAPDVKNASSATKLAIQTFRTLLSREAAVERARAEHERAARNVPDHEMATFVTVTEQMQRDRGVVLHDN